MLNIISKVGQKRVITCLAVSTILILSTFIFSAPANGGSNIEITPNATEHTVVIPFEKSFRFIATIKNNGSTTEIINMTRGSGIPQDWHLLAAAGQYKLDPGQSIDYIAVSEPNVSSESKEQTVKVPFSFFWDGGSEEFEVTVSTKILSYQDLQNESIRTNVSVLDKSNGEPVSGAHVLATLPSGIDSYSATTVQDGYEISLPSSDYIKKTVGDYQIDHTSTGYYFQVYAQGYQCYFESDYLPGDGDPKIVELEPLDQAAQYSLQETIESGYSIWWIRASADSKYFAFSQGAHGQPGREPPDQTKIVMTYSSGSVIWERPTGGECWGLDISSGGEYVAAGCLDGRIYLWDKNGQEVWRHNSGEGREGGVLVRWVKFSPDGSYLLSGPVATNNGDAGLFEVSSGNLLWSFSTGDWLREARFSANGKTVYLSSGNGTVCAVDSTSGELVWIGSGNHVIPFLLGINEQEELVVSSGKGRAFTALDSTDGSRQWQVVIDQTVTSAQMANDGSIIGSTVGGMTYGVNHDGSLRWARRYGGVGHNGVHYTKNGKYVLLGGPNPTLFDSNGNVLWQREKDIRIQMTGPAEQDTGGANAVWVSEDASLIILGGDDGRIDFYRGEVTTGDNTYSQLSGMGLAGHEVNPPPQPSPRPIYTPESRTAPSQTPAPALTHEPEIASTPAPAETPEPAPRNGGMSCGFSPDAGASGLGEIIILMGAVFVCFSIVRFRRK
ncbi:MAG: PQQ-binding-like beta-propeller repeat protein [Dehalococcoidales bacterium]|nr:PQQ-binding-like beta-propeller repeat protein [Dehalococcoidales bacterium]